MLFGAVWGDFRFTAKAALCHTVACRDLLPGSQCSQKRLLRHGLCLLPPRSIQRAEEGSKERISGPHCITCLYHLGSLFHNFPLYRQHLSGCAHCGQNMHHAATMQRRAQFRKSSPVHRLARKHRQIYAVANLVIVGIGAVLFPFRRSHRRTQRAAPAQPPSVRAFWHCSC